MAFSRFPRLVFFFASFLLYLHIYPVLADVTIPAPISIAPSTDWDGNDGPWSSFTVQVGTPPQNVRVLVSSSGSCLWTVLSQGCLSTDGTDCAESRGRLFNPNISSTWSEKGLYQLPLVAEEPLGYTGNGDFGFDTITLGIQGGGGPTLDQQVVAGYATKEFYIGMLGVTPRGVNFTDFNNPEQSILASMFNETKVASNSWAYTAGAKYTEKETYGSLTFGGYDTTRFRPNNLTFSFGVDISRDLLVGIQSITSGDTSLSSEGIIAYVDSTISQIWLPVDACKKFEDMFGLSWDEDAELYFVDSDLHSKLLSQNPSITFTLGLTESGGQTVDIKLPYAAFDLSVSYPYIANGTLRYFPLKQAQNSSQYTLGRAFLQEAYLIVDYDRSNFSISQALFPDSSIASHLVPITAPTNSTSSSSHSSLSKGAIAGIAVAGGALILSIPIIALILRRRKKAREYSATAQKESEDDSATSKPAFGFKAELDANDTKFVGHEVEGDHAPVMGSEGGGLYKSSSVSTGTTIMSPMSVEADSKGVGPGRWNPETIYEMPADSEIREMPGGSPTRMRAELHGEGTGGR